MGVEVLYTSQERDGALAEIGFRLGLEPVWPSKIAHEIHKLRVRAERALLLPDLETLEQLGVETARYNTFEYDRTQALSSAAKFLGHDALIVPSARFACLNVVGIVDNLDTDAVELLASESVDWTSWRRNHSG